MPNVKITVLERNVNQRVIQEHAPMQMGACDMFEDGQEFIIDSDVVPPEGFCAWAYADIQKYILLLRHDGNPRLKHEGTAIACCTDGFRPVVFKLERME